MADLLSHYMENDFTTQKSKYEAMARQQEKQRILIQQAEQKEQEARMQDQLGKWQDAVEDLAKVEAMLANLIAQEIRHTSTISITEGTRQMAMNWTGRLDQIIGELGRYRETLMRRVADGLMPRLTGETEQEKHTSAKSTLLNQALPQMSNPFRDF